MKQSRFQKLGENLSEVADKASYYTTRHKALILALLTFSLITCVVALECNQNCAQHCNATDCKDQDRSGYVIAIWILLIVNAILFIGVIYKMSTDRGFDLDTRFGKFVAYVLPVHAILVGSIAIGCINACNDTKGCKTKAWKDFVYGISGFNITLGIINILLFILFKVGMMGKIATVGEFVLGKGTNVAGDFKYSTDEIPQEAIKNLKKFWEKVGQGNQWESL
jgi:hypothetical protein